MSNSYDVYEKDATARNWKSLAKAVLEFAVRDADLDFLTSNESDLYKDLSGWYDCTDVHPAMLEEINFARTHTLVQFAEWKNWSIYYTYTYLRTHNWKVLNLESEIRSSNFDKYESEITEMVRKKTPLHIVASIFSVPKKVIKARIA